MGCLDLKPAGIFGSKFQIYIYVKEDSFTSTKTHSRKFSEFTVNLDPYPQVIL
jgi:hypothetical protein